MDNFSLDKNIVDKMLDYSQKMFKKCNIALLTIAPMPYVNIPMTVISEMCMF